VLPDWSIPLGAVHWVTSQDGPIPKRVETLGEYLIKKLGWKAPDGRFHGTAHMQR
jgi:hypothetical protein